jgi:hypothetical protein
MEELIRLNIYKSTRQFIYEWAYELYKKYDIRAANNKPLHESFPSSLALFVKTCEGHKLNEVFK